MQTIGDRITLIIKKQGMNQSDFAKALKITPSSVSTMISGKSNPSAQTIQQICDKFGYNPEWLTTGEGDPLRENSRSDQLAATLGRILGRQDSATSKLIGSIALALSQLNDAQSAAVIDFMTEIIKSYNSE